MALTVRSAGDILESFTSVKVSLNLIQTERRWNIVRRHTFDTGTFLSSLTIIPDPVRCLQYRRGRRNQEKVKLVEFSV